MILGKTYLKGIENKLYLGNVLIYDPTIPPTTLKPIMTNFRVNEATPNHIHFDAPLGPVTGLTTQGFTVSGNTVSAIDTSLGYITVGTAFTHWQKAITVRLESGNGIVYDFKMESVYNLMDEPTATIPRYVTVAGGGNGESLGSPWTLAEACLNASQGMTVHVAKGDYGSGNFVVSNNGAVDNPIVFEGYDTTPGDNPSHVFDPDLIFSADKMPYINSGSTSGTGLDLQSQNYIIIKNIQIEGYNKSFHLRKANYCVLDNIYARGAFYNIDATETSNPEATYCSVLNSYSSNATGGGITLAGIGHLVEGCHISSNKVVGMDYHISMNGCYMPGSGFHVVRNNYIERHLGDSHTGHGITFYGTYHPHEYSLAEFNEIVNVRQAIENRGHSVNNCVYRDLHVHQTADDPTVGSKIVIACTTTSARDGWFERINAHGFDGNGIECAVRFLTSSDDPNSDTNGLRNTVVNSVFDNVTYGIRTCEDGNAGQENLPSYNEVINCTFNNITRMFFHDEYADTGVENKVINCIINNVPTEFAWLSESGYGFTGNWEFENCDHWDWWGVNGTPQSGVDNFSVNPDLNAEYQPQAPFNTISIPLYPGVYYDEHKSERQDPTTVGSISSSEESPSEPTDELVIDGEFAFNDTYWDIAGGTSNITNNEATIATTGTYTYLSQDNVMQAGLSYTVEFDVISTNGEALADDLDTIVWDTSTPGSKTQVITADEARLMFKRRVGSTDTNIVLDNISVKLN